VRRSRRLHLGSVNVWMYDRCCLVKGTERADDDVYGDGLAESKELVQVK
jgi:hypothetical protein